MSDKTPEVYSSYARAPLPGEIIEAWPLAEGRRQVVLVGNVNVLGGVCDDCTHFGRGDWKYIVHSKFELPQAPSGTVWEHNHEVAP